MYVVPTYGERFYISRVRKNFTQAVQAVIYGVSPRRINEWEHDKRTDTPIITLEDGLQPWEKCHLLRRRYRTKLADLAQKLDRSIPYIKQLEQGFGDWTILAKYYEDMGWDLNTPKYLED